MKTVAEVLRTKSNALLYSIDADDSLLDGLRIMSEKGIGALVVLSGGRLVGIVSERDYVRKVALAERSMLAAKVSEIMTRDVISVGPRDSLQHCMELMTERRLRHLPVLAEGELIGLLSIGDLVKETIAEQADLIRQLEQYIRGEH
ncbi:MULTISPECIES: CBS domain-containing protein [Pseudomonas]|uniref:CBS domain-containing protein n=2 Tax=Ectopseudomonas TaxID=3236654 RepID=A0A653B3J6_ECTOL|nr:MULTISPECIES: CBS domain-containing protein [Pseudomonas]MBK60037.1 CBS domain-containing protein [Pseudomonas sp.]CAE6959616.1 Inosine-5'-monophosphate dehydrogenase [Pseudomonas oleovorans]QFT24224.1 Hypoxic response protein 1 [Pseudomonas sp. THAF187a]QFT44411.1 Hypoxic response protein 1 [Pseudomonas sp. THAF42]QTS86048.1 CBS domain-containing protein [Pseudomonas khazarica]|tara:strand:- start:28852 stop:29289 length:438 start_codon:yes stop_codon:yes gene_type:complete